MHGLTIAMGPRAPAGTIPPVILQGPHGLAGSHGDDLLPHVPAKMLARPTAAQLCRQAAVEGCITSLPRVVS
jgi:hypothetical protein